MFLLILFFLTFLFEKNLNADEIQFADSHGPITVMGDHLHKKNELMFSLRFSKMNMDGMLSGNNVISANSVMSAPNGASDGSGTYMNSPISMKMNMFMFGAMYAPTDNLTLMAMSSFNQKEMISQRMRMRGGSRFNVNSSGVGDTRISALLRFLENEFVKINFAFGLSFPTGGIDERDATPTSLNSRLGYKMQQFQIKRPISGDNSNGYRYGTSIDTSIWLSYRWKKNFSTSLKINFDYLGNIDGEDDQMNKRMSPVMDSKNIGHQKLNLGFGFNYVNAFDYLKNNRLAFELILPLHQRVRGIQMANEYKIMIGWQNSFKGF